MELLKEFFVELCENFAVKFPQKLPAEPLPELLVELLIIGGAPKEILFGTSGGTSAGISGRTSREISNAPATGMSN